MISSKGGAFTHRSGKYQESEAKSWRTADSNLPGLQSSKTLAQPTGDTRHGLHHEGAGFAPTGGASGQEAASYAPEVPHARVAVHHDQMQTPHPVVVENGSAANMAGRTLQHIGDIDTANVSSDSCLLYTSPSPRD